MQRSSFRLSWPLRVAVYGSFGLLLLTGAAWMYAQRRLDDEAWEKIPRLLLTVHGGAAMVALLALGALTPHIKRGWSASRNRLSGILVIALNAFLVVSGYGLYYAGGEDSRAWLSRWHGWIGLVVGLALPGHAVIGRIIMRRLHERKLAATARPRLASGLRRLP